MGFTELGNWLGATWSQNIPIGNLQYHLEANTFLIGVFWFKAISSVITYYYYFEMYVNVT